MTQEQTSKTSLFITNFQVWARDVADALGVSPEEVMKAIYQYLQGRVQATEAQGPISLADRQDNLSKNHQSHTPGGTE